MATDRLQKLLRYKSICSVKINIQIMKRIKRKSARQGRERNYAEFQKGNFAILSRETFADFHLLVTFKNSVKFVAEYIM